MIESTRLTNFKIWHIVLLLVVLQLAIGFLTVYRGLGFDEAIWHYIGRNWFRHGLVPYKGGIDNKSPFIYAIYGVSDFLFGVNCWFPRLVAIVFQTAGIYIVYLIAKHIQGKQSGIIAMLLYGFSLLWRSVEGKTLSLTQVYEISFLLIAVYWYLTAQRKRYFFLSGLAVAVAIAFRFSGCVIIVPIALAMHRSKTNLVFFLGGLFVGLLAIFLLFSLAGLSIHEFFVYSFWDNFSAGSVSNHTFAWKLEQFANQLLYSEMILFYPFVIAYFFIRKSIDFFLLWLIASFCVIAAIGMFARSHLKELLPPLSLISAFAINYLLTRYKVPIKPILLILAICFFPKTFEPFWAVKNLVWTNESKTDHHDVKEDDDHKKKLGLWIKSNTWPEEEVYIAGYGAQAQCYSERLSPSIYFNITQTPLAKRQLFSDLLDNKPPMLAVPVFSQYKEEVDQDIRAFVDTVVSRNYYLDTCLYGYNVYKRKGR